MKTKEKNEKRRGVSFNEFVGLLLLTLIVFSVVLSIFFIYTSVRYTSNIVALHSQILNLTHSLTQANTTVINLNSKLIQAQITMAMQKAQIINLTNLLNLNKSQVIFNREISIGLSSLTSTCNIYGCYSYPSESNITLHFTFVHAGYIVVNTTGTNYVLVELTQNYSKTWFGVNNTGVVGNFNYSVRSLTMPVLPGPAALRLFYYNATVPYQAQLTITYYS